MPRSHIGVTTEVSVQSAPTSASVPSGRLQLAGITAKGPLNYSGLIRSTTQYISLFGARAPYETLYDTVRTFFQEGGGELYVTRVVGGSATNGSVILQSADSIPVDVVSIEVKDPGAHSSGYRAVVTTNTDNTFNVVIEDSVSARIIATFQRAESPADLVSLAMGNEQVIVRALGTANPAPGPFYFTAGNDDRAAITAADYGRALNEHKGVRAGVAVAAPGQHPVSIAPALGNHCQEHKKIGLLEIPAGMTISEAKGIGTALLGESYGAYLSMPIYPHIRIPDGSDRSRTVSPVGYVAAQRSVVHRSRSYAAAVAGPAVKSLWNFQVVERLSEIDTNELNQAGVNAIQSVAGSAPYLNNWSSLSEETGLYDLNVTDALNNLTVTLEHALGELIWRPNEGRETLRGDAQAIVDGIMAPLVAGGYLFPSQDLEGNFMDNGYVVDVEDIRTSSQPSPYDQITINVSVKLSPTLRHIHVPIRKVDLRQAI